MAKLSSLLAEASREREPREQEMNEEGEDYSPEEDMDEERKSAFMEMAQAIKSGDFEAAWAAWKDYC